MSHRFGTFELDEAAHALRLVGRELPRQPRVLDFLNHLVRHAERVVPKDDLLDAPWPDVLVAEGSLQRVASLVSISLRAERPERAGRARKPLPRHRSLSAEPGPIASGSAHDLASERCRPGIRDDPGIPSS